MLSKISIVALVASLAMGINLQASTTWGLATKGDCELMAPFATNQCQYVDYPDDGECHDEADVKVQS